MQNPFNITKAVDFSDTEINTYWVDFAAPGGFVKLAKPTSPMPMLLLGGKGSGKTHLMRYFAYQAQKLRHQPDLLEGIRRDQYLGIYLRCGGLNASRFDKKGQTDEAWAAVFAYYMELWLAQLLLSTLRDAFSETEEFLEHEAQLVRDILRLFDRFEELTPLSLANLCAAMERAQHHLDAAINNCAITRQLDVTIGASPGRLIFGIPRLAVDYLSPLKDCTILYLLIFAKAKKIGCR